MLPGGTKEYKSLVGAILTVVTLIVVLFYGIYKYVLLVDKD